MALELAHKSKKLTTLFALVFEIFLMAVGMPRKTAGRVEHPLAVWTRNLVVI